MKTELRLKIRHFVRKYKRILIVGLLIWLVVFIINQLLKNYEPPKAPETTYTPHTSVMNSSSTTPKSMQTSIENMIEEYVGYCNNGNYQVAFEMLSDECKMYSFNNEVKNFVSHVLTKMPTPKEHSIQNYSNENGLYTYQIKYTDDFLTTGLTNQTYSYTEEKMTFQRLSDGKISMAVGNFIRQSDIKSVIENEYLKVDLKSKIINYSIEKYEIKLTNRSDYTVVIADNNETEEVLLVLPYEYRNRTSFDESIVLGPKESKEITLTFTKFSDDGDMSQYILFNSIRIMEVYSGVEVDTDISQSEIENAISKFSMQIPIIEK